MHMDLHVSKSGPLLRSYTHAINAIDSFPAQSFLIAEHFQTVSAHHPPFFPSLQVIPGFAMPITRVNDVLGCAPLVARENFWRWRLGFLHYQRSACMGPWAGGVWLGALGVCCG